MAQEFDEKSRDLALQDSTTKAIITAYVQADFKRIDEKVLMPLEQQHPSLRYLFADARRVDDPIASWRAVKASFEMVKDVVLKAKKAKSVLMQINYAIGSPSKEAFRETETQEFSELVSLCDMYARLIPIRERGCLQIAQAAKEVGDAIGLRPEEIFDTEQRREEVIRRAMPSCKDYEQFCIMPTELNTRMFSYVNAQSELLKGGNGQVNEKDATLLQKIPTAEALDAFNTAIRRVVAEDIERIYTN